MTRTCSSQTIHNFIGFLYVTGLQSCWYWEVFPASSRKLCGTHRIHFEEISYCVEFSEAACCSAQTWSHIWYFGIKVPKSSKKGTNFAPRPQKIVGEKTRSISATICCDLCTAVQYGYWHKCSYSHQNYSISRSGISIIQPARVDAGCTSKWQLPTTSTVNTNSSAGENRFMHQSVYAVYASIRKIRGTRKQISVAS